MKVFMKRFINECNHEQNVQLVIFKTTSKRTKLIAGKSGDIELQGAMGYHIWWSAQLSLHFPLE